MNWQNHVRTMRSHVVRIATPEGGGTGFILHRAKKANKLTIATASHVIRDAYTWNQVITVHHDAFEKPLHAWSRERSILLHPQFDSACLTLELLRTALVW